MFTIAIQTMMLAALALSWNVLGGYAGQISLGHAAFFGMGALITRELWLGGNSLPVAILVAVAVTAVVAAIVGIPMLRLHDIYFTMGLLAPSVWLLRHRREPVAGDHISPGRRPPRVRLQRSLLHEPRSVPCRDGGVAVAQARQGGYGDEGGLVDEEAAAATGVNAFAYKMIAFVISAALAALAGSAFAYYSGSYFPNFPFSVFWTFEAILVVFIGGIGTIVGPILGSAFFVVGRDALPSGINRSKRARCLGLFSSS